MPLGIFAGVPLEARVLELADYLYANKLKTEPPLRLFRITRKVQKFGTYCLTMKMSGTLRLDHRQSAKTGSLRALTSARAGRLPPH